jgi:hypothetical protein
MNELRKGRPGIRSLGVWASLLFLLAGCALPQMGVEIVTPPTTILVRTPATPVTPAPTPSPLPTLCSHARVSGKVCQAGLDVYLTTCCPEWMAITTSDERGAFAFESLTAGTFTVTAGLRSRQVTLPGCYSQVSVDLCPPPTPVPTP